MMNFRTPTAMNCTCGASMTWGAHGWECKPKCMTCEGCGEPKTLSVSGNWRCEPCAQRAQWLSRAVQHCDMQIGPSSGKGPASTPLEKRLGDRLWVSAPWSEFYLHMRLALGRECVKRMMREGMSTPLPTVTIVTDKELKALSLDEHRRAQEAALAMNRRPTEASHFRALEEVSKSATTVVQTPDLLVVRLGIWQDRNDSLPDIILQCLLDRETCRKTGLRGTWIHMEPTVRWEKSDKTARAARAWSQDVADHLDANYPKVSLVPPKPEDDIPPP